MKRSIAAGAMAAVLLAVTTAAFATPVQWTSVGVSLPKTSSDSTPITWFQPYNPVDPLNYPGSSVNDLILTDVSHAPTLTIVANDVKNDPWPADNDGETDSVYLGTTYLGDLKQGPAGADTTTVFTLSGPNAWLKGTSGFNVMVDLDGILSVWYPTTIKIATLKVWTDWQAPPPPPPPPPPPVVPAPGAMLLASIGAGLVSVLRTRKTL